MNNLTNEMIFNIANYTNESYSDFEKRLLDIKRKFIYVKLLITTRKHFDIYRRIYIERSSINLGPVRMYKHIFTILRDLYFVVPIVQIVV
jgi:hypothetical protein